MAQRARGVKLVASICVASLEDAALRKGDRCFIQEILKLSDRN
jgi:hypothetical protein